MDNTRTMDGAQARVNCPPIFETGTKKSRLNCQHQYWKHGKRKQITNKKPHAMHAIQPSQTNLLIINTKQ
jgi:hypothetical protein